MVGLLRFELRSQDPQPCRMDQATLQPHGGLNSKKASVKTVFII